MSIDHKIWSDCKPCCLRASFMLQELGLCGNAPDRLKGNSTKISVIIPVLNERRCLPQTLADLQRQTWVYEVIVADGGSTDGTREWLRQRRGVRLVEASAGRGIQLNAAAKVATGDALLFLHADTQLPQDAVTQIESALASLHIAGGCFCVRFASCRPRSLGVVAAGINLRTVLTESATGDQAIFARRCVFEEIGGFHEWPVFEDVDFVGRLKRAGGFAVIRSRVIVSPRRHIRYGVFRTVVLVYLLRLGFWAGTSPFTLARWYQNTGGRSKT